MSDHATHLVTKEVTAALDAIGKDFSAHSIFSPSGSAMWAYCSGSLIPNLFAKDSAGEDAAYGTVGHAVAEQWLKSGVCPSHLIGTIEVIKEGDQSFEVEIDASMIEYISQYVDWCIYLPGTHFVETRVDFSELTPLTRQSGTADHAACEFGTLTITDLKMGRGVQVFAKDNTQAVLYAYGFFVKYDELFDFQRIVIRIAQPRLDHFDEWVITRAELLEWAGWLKERAYAAWCKEASRTPGEKQCRWCRVKPDCAAHAVFSERLIDGVFDNLDKPVTAEHMTDIAERLESGVFAMTPTPIGSLTVAQKAALLPYRKMVESWFAEMHADLEQRCVNGEHVPGYKLVAGKSNRVFSNDEEAAELLDFLGLPDEVIHPRGMISPAQAETALTKVGFARKSLPDVLNPVVRKPPGKPTMCPESDKRQAIVAVVADTFENLDEL